MEWRRLASSHVQGDVLYIILFSVLYISFDSFFCQGGKFHLLGLCLICGFVSDFGEGEAATASHHNLDEALGADSDVENCAVGEYHRQRVQGPHQA